MTTNTEWLRQRITAGLDTDPVGDKTQSLETLLESQVSDEFRTLCDNRMVMGAFRYGLLVDQVRVNYDNVGSMITRLKLYQETGNLEHLVDVANIAMVEFVTGNHPLAHFDAADDDVHTARVE
jgi:hypothetical protein